MLRHLTNRSGNVCGRVGRWACGAALLFGIESTSARAAAQTAVPPRAAAAADAAPSKASCAEAYESAQESRASGALQQTRSRLAYCAQTECPAFVQKDCARWLEEVDRELPSVIISVVGLDEEAIQEASLKIDGRAIAEPLSGKAISLDPGKHQLVLERPGAEPVTRLVLAQQGVQNRSVELRVGAHGEASGSESVFDADVPGATSSPLRSLAFVSWGVGAVGFGAFAVLGTLARADENRFRKDCESVATSQDLIGPGICLESTAERRKAKYEREAVLADVGLVTGIIGAAAGTALFVLSASNGGSDDADPSAKSAARLELSPLPGGAWAGVAGAF